MLYHSRWKEKDTDKSLLLPTGKSCFSRELPFKKLFVSVQNSDLVLDCFRVGLLTRLPRLSTIVNCPPGPSCRTSTRSVGEKIGEDIS